MGSANLQKRAVALHNFLFLLIGSFTKLVKITIAFIPQLLSLIWLLNSDSSKNFVYEVIKNFNKKELEYIELPTQKKKKKLIHEVLQFPSTSIQILNCYIIVYYKYLLPMWVAMSL